MKGLRHYIRNFFGFSKTQTNGFVVLLLIVSFSLFSKPVYHTWISHRPSDFSREKKTLDSLTAHWGQAPEIKSVSVKESVAVTLFKFDPNTATDKELKSLGFSDRLAKGLQNYRAKGGSFRVKSDLKKIYGMDSAFYDRLNPFIDLPENITYERKTPETKKELVLFDLNLADTTQLQHVYGIGKVLAKRIVKYRESLGGFVKAEQLKEIYGLDSAVVKRIVGSSFLSNDFEPRRLNINNADEKTLSSHPYFSRKLARAIVAYRFQHGNYQTIDDLRKIELIDHQTANRIYPYVTIE